MKIHYRVVRVFLLVLLCNCGYFYGWSQIVIQDTLPSRPFVKLKNGPLFVGKHLEESPLNSSSFFRLDSNTFEQSKVLFFQDDQLKLYGLINGTWNRADYGSGNIYFFHDYTTHRSYSPGSSSSFHHTDSYNAREDYYSIGLKVPKRFTYDNLKADMGGSPKTDHYLNKAYRQKKAIPLVIVGGLVLMGTGANRIIAERPHEVIALSMTFGSFLGGFISVFCLRSAHIKNLYRAVATHTGYNPLHLKIRE